MLKLVKTLGGSNGAPNKCNRCHGKDFKKSNLAWHCIYCGTYVPTELGFETIKTRLQNMEKLTNSFKLAIDDLERTVDPSNDIGKKR